MEHLLTLNPELAIASEIATYTTRTAARAVIVDSNNCVALLHVQRHDYFKLPGGGIEEGESVEEALLRECMEETGCTIAVEESVGSIIEYRKIFGVTQTSYCFLASVVGDMKQPSFTEYELNKGFALVWIPLQKVLETLQQGIDTMDLLGREYIVPRDLTFFEKAQNVIFK